MLDVGESMTDELLVSHEAYSLNLKSFLPVYSKDYMGKIHLRNSRESEQTRTAFTELEKSTSLTFSCCSYLPFLWALAISAILLFPQELAPGRAFFLL